MEVQVECREIGTLRLSAPPNQMSWMQPSAKGEGAWAWRKARAKFEKRTSRVSGLGRATSDGTVAGKTSVADRTTAATGAACRCSLGAAQHDFIAQQPEHATRALLPGIRQDAGRATSGCAAVASISSNVTMAGFMTAPYIALPGPRVELCLRSSLHPLVRCIHPMVSESSISSNAFRLGSNSSGLHLSMSL